MYQCSILVIYRISNNHYDIPPHDTHTVLKLQRCSRVCTTIID